MLKVVVEQAHLPHKASDRLLVILPILRQDFDRQIVADDGLSVVPKLLRSVYDAKGSSPEPMRSPNRKRMRTRYLAAAPGTRVTLARDWVSELV